MSKTVLPSQLDDLPAGGDPLPPRVVQRAEREGGIDVDGALVRGFLELQVA